MVESYRPSESIRRSHNREGTPRRFDHLHLNRLYKPALFCRTAFLAILSPPFGDRAQHHVNFDFVVFCSKIPVSKVRRQIRQVIAGGRAEQSNCLKKISYYPY